MLAAMEFGLRQAGFPMDLVESAARRQAVCTSKPSKPDTDWLMAVEVPSGDLRHFEQLSRWSGDEPERGNDDAAA